MLFLSYALALGAILYYFIVVPEIVPEKLSIGKETSVQKKIGIGLGILFLVFLISVWFKPEIGYTGSNSRFPLILLFMSTSLSLWALIEVKGKVQSYYQRTYQDVMNETSGAQEQLLAANLKITEVEARETKLLELDQMIKNKEITLADQERSINELQNKVLHQESKIKADQGQLNTIIQLQVNSKEREIQGKYDEQLRKEKETLQENYNHRIMSFVDQATEKMQARISSDKKELLDDVFSFEGSDKDDFFEMKQLKESLTHEKEEIEKSRFLVEMEQKVSQANEHVINAKTSALGIKSENVDLRTELKLLAKDFKLDLTKEQLTRENSIDSILHKLEMEQERRKSDFQVVDSKLSVMDAQTKARFVEMHSNFSNALNDLQVSTANTFREVRESMGDMKLQFGQEILRLDGQQGQILTELEKYYAKNQQYVNQCQSFALEARQNNMNGQQILNQVNTLHAQYKLESKDIESRLRSSMDLVSVKQGQLANTVGESMLKLKGISDQQHSAMRELSLEKKDVSLLWREKHQKHELDLQEVRHKKNDLEMSKKLLNQEQSNFNQHKSSVMENARLTHRNYMQEQEYKMAMFKAENSGGWLSRWAKRIEKMN